MTLSNASHPPPDHFLASPFLQDLERIAPFRSSGTVTEVVGLLVESDGPAAASATSAKSSSPAAAASAPRSSAFAPAASSPCPSKRPTASNSVTPSSPAPRRPLAVGRALLGRVLDGFGRPIDGGPLIEADDAYPLYTPRPAPRTRTHLPEPFVTGIRAIDGMLPCGKGQRVGIFGGSGVGKSTLLGACPSNNDADVSVLALIGERNREVRDFIEHELGPEGLARSVVIVATSDRPPRSASAPLRRPRRRRILPRPGQADVLLVMDSVTRLAMAQREIGLAAGEPPSQKGYTPSVFRSLPKIFERAGNFEGGSITGLFTVLVEGDDMNEPIADAVRGILDGHIVLSRALGQPATTPPSTSFNPSAASPPRGPHQSRRLRRRLQSRSRRRHPYPPPTRSLPQAGRRHEDLP
jgi:flagellum-specific ATP synthase